jgi:serine/threonine-protein kinase
LILCPSCNRKNDDGAKFCPKCGSALVRAPGADDDDVVGRIIAGKFRIEALIGEGGMGKVFRATQMSLDKTIVLKVLRSSLLGDARTVARFQREAKAASRLNHPNSISVIDFGQCEDNSLYIAMEYVAGEDLHQLLSREGPLAQRRICRVAGQVLSALADAHAAGVIHRDLKPENIMVEQRRGEPDFVKVLDFGIAKIQEGDGHGDGQALTRAGFVCGTPEYMSPEQARGLQLDARSDLYAVGVILYQCATNQLPFEGDSAVALATMHLTTAPTPPREKRPDAPITDTMEALILKAMEKDPAHRPQSAEEFRKELLALEGEFDRTRVQTLPPVVASLRNSGSLRRLPKSGNGHAPSKAVDQSVATWASSPGQVDDGTSVTSAKTTPSDELPTPEKGRPTVAIFAGALVITALLAGGGFFVYDRWVHRGAQTITVPDPPRPRPGDVSLVEPGADGTKKEIARARDKTAEGDTALANTEYGHAVGSYIDAYQIEKSPGRIKRVALGYLLEGNQEKASEWLERYIHEAKTEPDAELVSDFLKNAKKR